MTFRLALTTLPASSTSPQMRLYHHRRVFPRLQRTNKVTIHESSWKDSSPSWPASTSHRSKKTGANHPCRSNRFRSPSHDCRDQQPVSDWPPVSRRPAPQLESAKRDNGRTHHSTAFDATVKRRLFEEHYARCSQLAVKLKIPFDISRETTDSTTIRSTLLAVAAPLSAAVAKADQDQENSEPTPASDSGSDHSGSGPMSEKESEAEEKAQLAIISSDSKRDLQPEEERDDNRLLNRAPPEPSDDGTSAYTTSGRNPCGHQETGEGTDYISRATSTIGVASMSTRATRSAPLPIVESIGAEPDEVPLQPAYLSRHIASRFGPLSVVDSTAAEVIVTSQRAATQTKFTRSNPGLPTEEDRGVGQAAKQDHRDACIRAPVRLQSANQSRASCTH